MHLFPILATCPAHLLLVNSIVLMIFGPIPMTVRSKAMVYAGLTVGVAGSNPAADMTFVFVVCCVGSGLCNKLITRPEESYWECG